MEEEVLGEAVVLKTFKLTGAKAAEVGGCRVKSGTLVRNATYRLLRDDEVRKGLIIYHDYLFICTYILASEVKW